jgi:hypothetical protein
MLFKLNSFFEVLNPVKTKYRFVSVFVDRMLRRIILSERQAG